jgi:hypothetical protein
METQKAGYTINPAYIEVTYNKKIYKPIIVRGPYWGGGYAQETQGVLPGLKWNCIHPDVELPNNFESLSINEKTCVEVEFSLNTFSPDEEFQVTLGGIMKSNSIFCQ